MNSLFLRLLAVSLTLACLGASRLPDAGAADATLIRARFLYTMNGPPQENVEILVRDNKVVGIGESIQPLGTYQVIDAHTVMPGLIDAYSSVGLRGGENESTREVTPEFETASTIDWRSRDFREAVSEGVTSANIMPGTDNVIAGFACLVKTAGDDLSLNLENRRIVQPHTGLAMAVCTDPTGGNRARTRPDSIYVRQPTNRMGVVWIIRSRLQAAKQAASRLGELDEVSQRLGKLLDGTTRAFGVSRTSFDIETLIALAEEFNFQPVLFGGHEAYKTVELLRDKNVPVVYTAAAAGATVGEERTDLFWNTPGRLDAAGVSVCLAGGDLLNRARFAKRYGMDADSALQAITTRPAALLGVGERVGQVAPDFDADLIALDGPPLEFTSNVQWVMVEGQLLDLENGE